MLDLLPQGFVNDLGVLFVAMATVAFYFEQKHKNKSIRKTKDWSN
ncbi:MAG TPA: hypothetical protein PLT92_14155 [Ignavibacteriaceae bacterium]|nr:hypothetical protein [Ignavibacteriaceae bacterium]